MTVAQLGGHDLYTVYEDVDGDNEYMTRLPRDQEMQFNVIAIVESANSQ